MNKLKNNILLNRLLKKNNYIFYCDKIKKQMDKSIHWKLISMGFIKKIMTYTYYNKQKNIKITLIMKKENNKYTILNLYDYALQKVLLL
ncbi:MAG: hypothetical protein [Cotesia congregata filamentous virus 2]